MILKEVYIMKYKPLDSKSECFAATESANVKICMLYDDKIIDVDNYQEYPILERKKDTNNIVKGKDFDFDAEYASIFFDIDCKKYSKERLVEIMSNCLKYCIENVEDQNIVQNLTERFIQIDNLLDQEGIKTDTYLKEVNEDIKSLKLK